MKTLKITNFGPIKEAEVELADITILVGPQATGKSLFLQFLNLVINHASIIKTLKNYAFTWESKKDLLALYLGIDMEKNWQDDTKILENSNIVDIKKLAKSRPRTDKPNTFYIPAQRVLTMPDGYPRPFLDLISYPYIGRDFSERLRRVLEMWPAHGKVVFPQEGKFKKAITDKLHKDIFRGSKILLEKEFKKRLVLDVKGDGQFKLPFLLWSAGQREFMLLLLGLSYLIPGSKKSKKDKIETVIIEEIEMGLHPRAILGVMLAVMELIKRGYRVVISTHSLHVVEIIWAIKKIKESKGDQREKTRAFVERLFRIENARQDVKRMAEDCLKKDYKVYYFEPEKGTGLTVSRDISELDPFHDDTGISGWGGLSEFSSNIVDVVAGLQGD